eukprot:291870_1
MPAHKVADDLSTSTKRVKGVQIGFDTVGKILESESKKVQDIIKGISFLGKISKFAGPIGFVLSAVGDIISIFKPEDNSLKEYVGKISEQLKKCVDQKITSALTKEAKKHLKMLDPSQIKLSSKISPRLRAWERFQSMAYDLTKLLGYNESVKYYEALLPAISPFVQELYFGSLGHIAEIYECIKLNDTNKCNPEKQDGIEDVMRLTKNTLNVILSWAIQARDKIYYHYKFSFPMGRGAHFERWEEKDNHRGAPDSPIYTQTGFYVVNVPTNIMYHTIEWWAVVPWTWKFHYYMNVSEHQCHIEIKTTNNELIAPKCKQELLDYYDDNWDNSLLLFYEYHSYVMQIRSYLNYIRDPSNSSTELIFFNQDTHCHDTSVDLGEADNVEDCEKKCIEYANKNDKPCIYLAYGHRTAGDKSKRKNCRYLPDKCKEWTRTDWYNIFARVKQIEPHQVYSNKRCRNDEVHMAITPDIETCIHVCYAQQPRNGINEITFCKWIAFDRINKDCYRYEEYDCDIIDDSKYDLARMYETIFFMKKMSCAQPNAENKGHKKSVEICAEECEKDKSCQDFIYSETEGINGWCYFQSGCSKIDSNSSYNLYSVVSLIGKGKKCQEERFMSGLYVSPKACSMHCISNNYTYIAFGNEANDKPRECICYKNDVCTEIDDFDFDLYSSVKKHIACPEKYKVYDDDCCYGYTNDDLNEEDAQMYCEKMSRMEWIKKDYSSHGYTCCIQGSESVSYFVDIKSWIDSHFLLSNILVSTMSCLFVLALFVTGLYICKGWNDRKKIKYD